MTALWILFGIILLPFVLIMVAAIVSAVYIAWILLLAVCGFKWAQDAWQDMG